jgi:hypothetical protein
MFLNNFIKGKTATAATSSSTNEVEQQPRKGKRLSEEDPKSLMKRVALGDVTNKQEKHKSTTLTRLTRVCQKLMQEKVVVHLLKLIFSVEQKERAGATEFIMCRICRQDISSIPGYAPKTLLLA